MMKIRTTTFTLLFSVFFMCFLVECYAYRDRGSWKKTLHEKAMQFEEDAAERHNIVGSYPSSVVLFPPRHYVDPALGGWKTLVETGELPPGWTFDHGTSGDSNVAHTSSWTGCLLTGAAFRVAFLRDSLGTDHPEYKAAYERANEIIHSLRILTLVSGQPGFLARGVALGHGISYEERAGADTRDLWKQGKGEFSYLRYRGGPSHHNYDHVFRGLGIYYFVAADDAQKGAIREIVRDMSEWAHLKNDMQVMHDDGIRESTVLIGGWRGMEGTTEPSGGSLMATTGLKIAALITGNKKVERLYEKWVDRLGYRDPKRTEKSIMGSARGNYDDTDHLLGDLYLLNLIEKDPDLLRFYRKCVKDSWEAHKGEKQSWFNFVYRAVLGGEYGDPEGSIWNLQTFPTCRIFQPQMNSIRTDIEFVTHNGRKEAKEPLPVYERRSDNEYEWKGSPFALDGWTSRIVSAVEISPLDPYVQFAADTSGRAYWSVTQGEIWQKIDGLSGVKDFLFSPDYSWIVFAASSNGIYRSLDGGRSWPQVYSASTERLWLDPENSHVCYAVGPNGIYKSADFGERNMGTGWMVLTETAQPGSVFAVDPRGDKATIYMLSRDGLYKKQEGESEWQAPERMQRPRGFGDFDPVGGQPLWLRVDATTPDRLFRAVQIDSRGERIPFISVSEDGGETWIPVLRQLQPLAEWANGTGKTANMPREELMRNFGIMREFRITDICVDHENPKRWYGQMESAVAITEDAGENWTQSNEGLDIPLVQAISMPRAVNDLYAGTPAGLYVSRDHGKTWQDTALILQQDGTERAEIGGNGYLTAYWSGRYHGFIDEKTANEEWWK